jgi:TRAP-type C4-dicarboxylate transport system substrate-binding protein
MGVLVLVAAACAAASCTGPPAERAGGTRVQAIEVGFVDRTPGQDSPAGPEFLAALSAQSDGSWQPETAPRPGADAASVLDEVRSGELQLAWLRTDELEAAGLTQLAPLQAPFLVTTASAQAAVTSPRVAGGFLRSLEPAGVVGVALWGGPLRRPIAAGTPLLDTESWRERKVRSLSATQSAAFRALGAIPVEVAGDLNQLVPVGLVDAAETDLPRQLVAADTTIAPYITADVVLWSRFAVLVANQAWFGGLDDDGRGWVEAAAERARIASIPTDGSEAETVSRLCETGARFPSAGEATMARLRASTAPVLAALRAEPTGRDLLAAVETAVASVAGTDRLAPPSWCTGSVSPLRQVASVPSTRPPVPPGTYRVHLTAEDISAAGVGKVRDAQVVTLVLEEDGSYTNTSRFDDDGSVMVFEAGYVRGDEDSIYFVNDLGRLRALAADGISACVWTDPSLGCITNTTPYSVRWDLGPDGSITFSDPVGVNPDPVLVLTIVEHPYQRVPG